MSQQIICVPNASNDQYIHIVNMCVTKFDIHNTKNQNRPCNAYTLVIRRIALASRVEAAWS